MEQFLSVIEKYLYWLSIPQMSITDILDILIVSVLIYEIAKWIKNTRAWTLLKGIMLLVFVAMAAYVFQLHTISWLINNTMGVGVTAAIIVFQPELRNALEQLGRKNPIVNLFSSDESRDEKVGYTDRTLQEIVRATIEMSKVKTGALIVMEREVPLGEFERTGIPVDAKMSSQLLINIFEHNTPLHDGAVIVRGNRIVAATCYLPLSDNMELSKQLGTRHRAGVGISEVTDSVTIIVSEETGQVSVAQNGRLLRNISSSQLREVLEKAQNKKIVDNNKLRQLLKGRVKHEEKNRK